ncbi:unnamed protein product [Nippostrongylus brasiliensis]|uniref:Endoplasmic reticulum resident protein 44 (inferred by orthology to a human protein) n=1 Tax=Nippostrongylus brasiliensis TaxID=27835 RepID=A0A0N4Y8V2_NIPBR|nr:unnamed protein product [Nippostrongylus brasiliensis]
MRTILALLFTCGLTFAVLPDKLKDAFINLRSNFEKQSRVCNIYDEANYCQQLHLYRIEVLAKMSNEVHPRLRRLIRIIGVDGVIDGFIVRIRHLSTRILKSTMWETVVLLTLISGVRPDSNSNAVVSIDETNLKHLLTGHQLVFMTFGANWCPYSINLEPIFEEAAKEFEEHYSTSDVIWASVECTAQQRICERYGINKYPTIKLFCFGDPVDEEYSENQLEQLRNKQRRSIIAYLTRDGAAYETLYRIALSLHEFCDFWAPSEELSLKLKTYELGRVIFKSPNAVALIQFDDRIENFGNLRDWIVSNCIPDVRYV